MSLKVEEEGVVKEFLDVIGDLRAVEGAVVGKADFDGNVEKGVAIGVDVEGDDCREKIGGVEEEMDLRKALEGCSRRIGRRRRLRNGNVLDSLTVVGFLADVGDDVA